MTLYYFTADWCAPCKKTLPMVLAVRPDTVVVDIDNPSPEERRLMDDHVIMNVPFILNDGVPVPVGKLRNRHAVKAVLGKPGE